MRLKKLELYGFKSFAARTEIVFGDGITGIVGPNGSGKSNIGDAVRWVLGEQSAKTLRGASMSDVIFNGTLKRKPLGYCEVSLVFDNEDRTLPLAFTEIMVTRRVYRNGDSQYFINQASCRLKDIVDLFRDTGIGREGYSIIGQGRIDDILSRRSEDRRQVFEEAAGIVKYRARKEEADRKLQRTLENAARADDILDEMEKRLGPLEEQSRAAREYLALTGELKGIDLNLFLLRSDRAEEKLRAADAELEGLKNLLADAEARLNMRSEERDSLQEEIRVLETESGKAREALLQAADGVHAAQESIASLQARRDSRRESLEALQGDQARARERLEELARLSGESEAGGEASRQRVAAAERALEEARDRSEALDRRLREQEDALETHKAEVLRQINRVSAVRNSLTRLTTMHAQMTERLEGLRQSSGQLTREEERLAAAVAAQEEALAAEERLRREREEALRESREAFDRADAELIGLRARAEKRSAELQAEQSRWKLLDEMTREMEGYSQSVRRAVQFARDRGLSGVRGVVAQLITVPARYETAVDMALGAAQQHIVTDTEETAKRIIDYLRQNRLGRATFLPMSAVRGKGLTPAERSLLSRPGCLGVASELIGCDKDCRPVIENLLGRTVIADSLDHGIPIMRDGHHAFRLVTLEGDVMHSGGSMTGGSAQSRMVNLLGRERELKELTARLKEGRAELAGLKEALAEGQARKEALRGAMNDALEALHQQEIAVARETEHLSAAQGALEEHRERLGETDEAVQQLELSIEEIDAQLRDISVSGDSAEDSRSAMEQETARLQDALNSLRAEARAAADESVARTLTLNEARHDADTLRRDSARLQEEKRRLTLESEERGRRLRQMAEAETADAAEQARSEEELNRRRAVQAQADAELRRAEETRGARQAALNELLRDVESLHRDIARDTERQHRLELQRSRVEGDLRALQDRVWNTWELTYAGAEAFRAADFREREGERRAQELNAAIRALGPVNLHAVDEYADTKARFDELRAQREDLTRAEADLRELITRLLRQMKTTFVASFTQLQTYFGETFARLFGGGHAELVLMDPDDPLGCGIEVNAQPPGKRLQLLSLLSGGERALTAIAILFAMLKLKPTPFCVLDEIEAALDDANIGYYADYLREYSLDTQFIVVTHRKGTMERCNALYGVAMEEQGVSRMVSVSLQDAVRGSQTP